MIALSSLLSLRSSCLRGSLKKDVGELRSAILCDFARNSLCPLCLCGSLKKDVWRLRGCDSEALLQAVRR